MALYIPHSIFHLARLLYVRPETFGPHYVPPDIKNITYTLFVLFCLTLYTFNTCFSSKLNTYSNFNNAINTTIRIPK